MKSGMHVVRTKHLVLLNVEITWNRWSALWNCAPTEKHETITSIVVFKERFKKYLKMKSWKLKVEN